MDWDMEEYIEYFTTQQATEKLPNTILISILLIFGVVGNITVLLVYKLKLKNIEKDRFFIPAIAITDFTACVFGGTLTILRNNYAAVFPSDVLCKGLWYMTGCVSGISAILLTIIAVTRYYKICEPTKKVWFLRKIKLTIAITVILIALFGIPLLFLHGLRPFDFTVSNSTVTGLSCTDIELPFLSLKYLKYVYIISISGILLTASISTCVMYSKIGHLIYKNLSMIKHKRRISINVGLHTRDVNDIHEPPLTAEPMPEFTQTIQADTDINEFNTSLDESTTYRKRKSLRTRRKRTRNNFTYMFICVTLISFVTYLPSAAFFIIPGENPNKFWMELSSVKLNFFLTLSRMYMFAHASNPFTYLYFDLDFRKALVNLIRNGKDYIFRKEN